MSRRILYVIDGLQVGGAEVLLLKLLDAASVRGDQTHVAYFSTGPLEQQIASRGVGMTRLSKRGLLDPLVLHRLTRLIRSWHPEVVHTHLVKSDLVGQVAARMTGTRRVLTLHNTDPWRRTRLLSLVYRAATNGADSCIAVSDGVADHVASFGGYPRRQIEVIQNGVDLDHFNLARIEPMSLSPFGVLPGAVVVAVIGRLTPQKDHENFLRAAARLASCEPRMHFLIVGDGPLREKIAGVAAELGLGENRLTLTGVVCEMPALLAAIDILVLSSKWEGLPMTMLEAMAMGRAIVSTSVGGVPEVIRHGHNGLLVPPSDPAALADAIGHLVADDGERRRLGSAARMTVQERFDAAAMLDHLRRVYDRGSAAMQEGGGSISGGRAPARIVSAATERSQ